MACQGAGSVCCQILPEGFTIVEIAMVCVGVLPQSEGVTSKSSDKSNIPSAVVVFVVVVCLLLLSNLATSESSDKSNIPPAGTNSTFHSLQIFYTLPNVGNHQSDLKMELDI